MGWIPQPKAETESPAQKPNSGIALFMVIAAVSMLSILVIEFTYTAQVNKKIAYDSLDSLKAHYLAKSGLKLSLLRLKAYLQVKAVAATLGGKAGAGAPTLPKGVLERIWSFPFMYPIPTSIPGLSIRDKDSIEKFQKESAMDGSFTSIIESESAKYNLNQILAAFAPTATPSSTPTHSPPPAPPPGIAGSTPNPTPNPSPSVTPFDPQAARNSLGDFLFQIFSQKMESDQDFASEYRDLKVEDLVDTIAAWADYTYERKQQGSSRETIPMKKAPFFNLSELHMVPGFDDTLYDLFAPNLTVDPTPGININMMGQPTLRALVPQMTEEETKEFFKFRDSEEEDNLFKDTDSFYKYLLSKVQAFHNSQAEIDKYKEELTKRQVRLVVDESEFRITVEAKSGSSRRTLQAWVTLTPVKSTSGTNSNANAPKPPASGQPPAPNPVPTVNVGSQPPPDTGLRITFMRIL